MIIKLLCDAFFGIANFLVGLCPTLPRMYQLESAIKTLSQIIRFANAFIDLRVVAASLLVLLVVYNAKFGWSIVMWIIRKIPGVS